MPGKGEFVSRTINWPFIGRGRVLLIFVLSLLIILAWTNLEKRFSELAGIWERALVLLAFFVLIIFAAGLLERAGPWIFSKHRRVYSLGIFLVFVILTGLYLLPKGFPSTTPLFWLIAISIIWAFLMILAWPVLLPVGEDTWDLANLRLLFFAKGPIGILGRFRTSQEHYLVGPVKHFLIATAVILLFTYRNAETVTRGMPLKNLTQWALNGTTWLSGSASSTLINGTRIMNDSIQAGSLPTLSGKIFDSMNISGGEISNIIINNTVIQGQTIINATPKIPINLSSNGVYSDIVMDKSIFTNNFISDATISDTTVNNISLANDAISQSLVKSLGNSILENISATNATIYNITLKNITLLNTTISTALNNTHKNIPIIDTILTTNSHVAPGNLVGLKTAINATIDTHGVANGVVENVTLKNASILDVSLYKTALDNISILNSSIVGASPSIPGSSEATGLILVMRDLLVGFAGLMDNILSNVWTNLAAILALWALIEILTAAWAAHKRIVIQDFKYKSDETLGELASELLATKIADLNAIYSKANETRAVPTSTGMDQPLQVSIKIQDVSNLFANIKVEKNFAIGTWFEIPANLLFSVIDGIVRGPKLDGRIDEDKDVLTLSAHVYGGGMPNRSWKVEKKLNSGSKGQGNTAPTEKIPSNETPANQPQISQNQSNLKLGTSDIDEAINELACRIFTDLVFNPSQRELVRWKATMKFGEGLRAYRDCLRSRMNKKLKLKEAERKFLQAQAEDEKFNMVWYNLGVVYNELDRQESADVAFKKAIKISPDQWEAYFALALNLFEKNQRREKYIREKNNNKVPWEEIAKIKIEYEEIIKLCDQVISLRPNALEQKAKAFNLKGLAQRYRDMADKEHNLVDLETIRVSLKEAIASHKKAVILSSYALFNAELHAGDVKEIRSLLTKCLLDLATDYYYNDYLIKNGEKYFAKSRILLEEAIFLAPHDAIQYTRLGQIYANYKQHENAVRQFERASGINPIDSLYLTNLAVGYNEIDHDQNRYGELAEHACDECLDLVYDISHRDAAKVGKVYCSLKSKDTLGCNLELEDKQDYAEFLSKRIKILTCLEDNLAQGKILPENLENAFDSGECPNDLIYAQAVFLLSDFYSQFNIKKAEESKKYLDDAAEKLEPDVEIARILCLKLNEDLEGLLHEVERYEIQKENNIININVNELDSDVNKLEERARHAISACDEAIEKQSSLNNKIYRDSNYCGKIEVAKKWCCQAEKLLRLIRDLNDKKKLGMYITETRKYFENAEKILEGVEKNKSKFVETCLAMGDLCMALEDSWKAEYYFMKSIDALRDHSERIDKLELKTKLAQVLSSKEGRMAEAWLHAEEGIKSNPLNYYVRLVLASACLNLNYFDDARALLEDALLLKPDDALIRYNIGITYLLQIDNYTQSGQRDEALNKAAKYLTDALDLLESKHSAYKMQTHYWLSVMYSEMKQYDQAISQLRVVQMLAKSERPSPEELIISGDLAEAYYNLKKYDAAEDQFKETIQNGEAFLEGREVDKLDLTSRIGSSLHMSNAISLGSILIVAYLRLADIYIEQSVTYREPRQYSLHFIKSWPYPKTLNKLDMALEQVQRSKEYVEGLKKVASEPEQNDIDVCEAAILDSFGWIAYKRSILEQKNSMELWIDGAISLLENSIFIKPTLGSYIHLAKAYAHKIAVIDANLIELKNNIPIGTTTQGTQNATGSQGNSSAESEGDKQDITSKLIQDEIINNHEKYLEDEKRRYLVLFDNCNNYIKSTDLIGNYSEDLKELENIVSKYR